MEFTYLFGSILEPPLMTPNHVICMQPCETIYYLRARLGYDNFWAERFCYNWLEGGEGNAAARKGWEGPSARARTYFYTKSRKAAKKTLVGEEVGGQITYSLFVFFLFNQSFKF